MITCTQPHFIEPKSFTLDLPNCIKTETNDNFTINSVPCFNIGTTYQPSSEIKLNYNISKKTNTSIKNYLVKIDDDFKLITECNHLNLEQLEKIIKTYYSSNEIEIFPVANNINLLSSYICLPNSFLTNNEIDPSTFVNYFNKFDEMIEYLNIFGNVQEFTGTLQHSVSKSSVVTHNVSKQLKSLSTEFFDTFGSYINDDIININDIVPDSGEIIGDIYDGTYECISSKYMQLDNFEESLLDFHKNYNIYFNTQFNNVLIIETISDFIGSSDKMKKIFPEIVFVSKERLDKYQYDEINKLTLDIFVNVDDIKSKINKILHDKVIDSKLSIDEIKFLIKKYFHIDTKPEHSVKFSNILEIIFSEFNVTDSFINYIKRQLPIILKDLGLNKKRLADGIYWYGLVSKPLDTSILQNKHKPIEKDTPIPIEEFKSKFDQYIMDRDGDLLSIISSYDNTKTPTFLKPSDLKPSDLKPSDLKPCDEIIKLNEKNTISLSNDKVIIDSTNQEQPNIPIKKQTKSKQTKPKKSAKAKNVIK